MIRHKQLTSDRPILVTGSHRCGSTWVGRTLVRSQGALYIYEPFHPYFRPGICNARPAHWYEYVSDETPNRSRWTAALRRTLARRYDLGAELTAVRGPRDIGRMVRDYAHFSWSRARSARVLLKDPIAFFSAAWIAKRFAAQIVVLTRHPAAFAHSLKRLDWQFDFGNWLDQPELVRDLLGEWRDELIAFRKNPGDVIDQAALCWKVIAGVTKRYQDEHPEWSFVLHEDLSRDPLVGFRDLCAELDLPFNVSMFKAVEQSTSVANPVEASGGTVHVLKRNSRANITSWKRHLDRSDVQRVRDRVGSVAEFFYDDSDW